MTAGCSKLARFALVALLFAGCDGDDEDAMGATESTAAGDDAPEQTGDVAFRFEVGSTAAGSTNLEDELTGSIYGAIFFTADVGVTGPRDGAESLASIEVHDIDLTQEGAVTEVVWMSDPLPPDDYTFLGYFDVDGSSEGLDDRDPDPGDPVTLPTVNTFTIEPSQTVEVTVRFDLIFS